MRNKVILILGIGGVPKILTAEEDFKDLAKNMKENEKSTIELNKQLSLLSEKKQQYFIESKSKGKGGRARNRSRNKNRWK